MRLIYTILPIMAISYIAMYCFDTPEFWQWKIYDMSRQLVFLLMSIIIYKLTRTIKHGIASMCLIILSGFELLAEILNQNNKGDVGDIIWQIALTILIIVTLKSLRWIK